jgi:hypothetical protein
MACDPRAHHLLLVTSPPPRHAVSTHLDPNRWQWHHRSTSAIISHSTQLCIHQGHYEECGIIPHRFLLTGKLSLAGVLTRSDSCRGNLLEPVKPGHIRAFPCAQISDMGSIVNHCGSSNYLRTSICSSFPTY